MRSFRCHAWLLRDEFVSPSEVDAYAPRGILAFKLNATKATTLHEYVFWPKNGEDRMLVDDTARLIKELVLPNPVWAYETSCDGLIWWLGKWTLETAFTIGILPGVSRAFPNPQLAECNQD